MESVTFYSCGDVTGIAYFEHDFADYYAGNPFYVFSFKEVYKNLRLTSSYSTWLMKQVFFNRPRVAPSWHRSSDNMAGWIWKWMVFENGWSIVIFLPAIICVSGGIVPVFLYLSKDGVNYSEFGCVNWRNIREKYIKRAGIYIPIEYEIIGRKGDTEFYIKYNSTTGLTALYGSDWSPDSKMESVTFYSCGDVTGILVVMLQDMAKIRMVRYNFMVMVHLNKLEFSQNILSIVLVILNLYYLQMGLV
jgi:hypothetical protein